jgi:hypothetical protein
MQKRSQKAQLTDPDSGAFATVEQATADEAEILRDIEEGTGDAASAAPRQGQERGLTQPKKPCGKAP